MRLDHLLSKEEEVGVVLLLCYQGITGDAKGKKLKALNKLFKMTFREAEEV